MSAGVLAIVAKLQAEMKSRGARGIIGIQRKFKIMDDDGSRTLSLGEFKKAMRECNLELQDLELRHLFNYFDSDGSGTIDFDEFLNGVRDPMNERRLSLVRLAFSKIDKDGNGILDAQDIVDCYDASKHPEVVAGRMSEDQVLREFLETFDVGGEVDGKVTPDEWANYYKNVSSSIDNDDYFELMIRNAWHISGGEGWCANSSNQRVLVTHADGRQTVEEIKNDLGVKADQYSQNLRDQGIYAAKIDTKGGVEDESQKGGQQSLAAAYSASPGKLTGQAKTKHAAFHTSSQWSVADAGGAGGGGQSAGDFGSRVAGSGSVGKPTGDKHAAFHQQSQWNLADAGGAGGGGQSTGDFGSRVAGNGSVGKPTGNRHAAFHQQSQFSIGSPAQVGASAGSGSPVTPAQQRSAHAKFHQGAQWQIGASGAAVSGGAGAPRTPAATASGPPNRGADAGLIMIVKKLQDELKRRGAKGIIGLGRKFRIMDDDGSKSLNMAEFKKAMKESNLSLSDREMQDLFGHFDQDRSGTIDFDEFLNGVRDPMNERRLSLVRLAFSKIDKDGNGILDAQDIVDCYDASKHPEVVAGRMSEDQVLREFLETFDVGGEVDGKVTPDEWANYYKNVSSSIDNDDYFELMIRNAWHISGGEGWCANSSNQRVLVTHADGRQTVEEIKNDLGVKADQYSQNLRDQGIYAAKIDTKGGVEDESQKGGQQSLAAAYSASPGKLTGQAKTKHAAFHTSSQWSVADAGGAGGGGQSAGDFGSRVAGSGSVGKPTGDKHAAFHQQSHFAIGNNAPLNINSLEAGGIAPGQSKSKHAEFHTRSNFSLGDNSRGDPNEGFGSRGASKAAARHGATHFTLGDDSTFGKSSKTLHAASAPPAPGRGGQTLADMARGGGGGRPASEIVRDLQQQLKRRGASGIIGLGRKFKIMDDDGSKSIDYGEFTKAMRECALELSDAELGALFRYFDRDGGGTLDYDEFINGVRGAMNERRLSLVRLAFSKIDKDGNGILDAQDIVDCFDASKHPEVVAGRMTPDQVFAEFLNGFDVGGEKDGMVTPQEWANYYKNVSSSIDDDDYFELMIRNAWHISGGEGWCANSSNQRVLVTHADGRQTVEEIKNDLGVKADQYSQNLRDQGIYAAKIDTKGGVEDESQKGGQALSTAYAQRPATASASTSNTFKSSPLW